MSNLKIVTGHDFYRTPCIVDADSGKLVRFEAHQVPGKGWTVAKVTGSKRTGRTIEVADGFETIDSYTMHQAQMAAENLTRDTMRRAYHDKLRELAASERDDEPFTNGPDTAF